MNDVDNNPIIDKRYKSQYLFFLYKIKVLSLSHCLCDILKKLEVIKTETLNCTETIVYGVITF